MIDRSQAQGAFSVHPRKPQGGIALRGHGRVGRPQSDAPLSLDLPGIDIASVARGFGCRAVDVETVEELEREFTAALSAGTTTVIVVPTQPQVAML
ncbi:thiamine pyrophosphate-dependent enzyme [Streptomyces yunnanensis]|uniref:Thiamine pyrophosphate enzyme, C-terminal TPP binding domain n=1 Tax=Streptomyces yunnanensis TaxID=156453 RepID=A0A9X8N2Z4_9ACTN|nr:thiamine pyrophosphate-dependent enzyme [Streptomyces yunnanensis]SHM79597.1 Thiamine pyrophosphate enzyme, C-terminal TPP binding domain [Streptomyces yunnanensis]